jgi:hypothetical protein
MSEQLDERRHQREAETGMTAPPESPRAVPDGQPEPDWSTTGTSARSGRRRRSEPDTAGFPLPAPAPAEGWPDAPGSSAPQPDPFRAGLGQPGASEADWFEPGPHQPEPLDPEPYDADDTDLFEPEWDRPKATDRITVLLAAALVGVVGFAGGIAAQKKHDAGLPASSAALASTLPHRTGSGGFGGAGSGGGWGGTGSGEGLGGPASGTGAGSAAGGFGPLTGTSGGTAAASGAGGSGPGSSSGVPVVVGTVRAVSETTLVVTNFAGTAVTVHVPASATVTTPGLGGLTVGATVSVSGTRRADGSVTATAVVSRRVRG